MPCVKTWQRVTGMSPGSWGAAENDDDWSRCNSETTSRRGIGAWAKPKAEH